MSKISISVDTVQSKGVRTFTREAIDQLSKQEREVLGAIYVSHDTGHPRRTVQSLIRKGWVIAVREAVPGKRHGSPIERLPVIVTRYMCPTIAAHMAWCAWCAAQPDEQIEHDGRLLAALVAIGSAHAGEPLTPEALYERLRDPNFRRRFNGPPPPKVTFPDEETAAVAAAFENAATRRP